MNCPQCGLEPIRFRHDMFFDAYQETGLCQSCQDEQRIAELQPDAVLGALVRRMPFGYRLYHSQYPRRSNGHWFAGQAKTTLLVTDEVGPIPEAALREALKEQDG